MSVRIRPVPLGRGAQPFIDVMWRVYRADSQWIPPLRRQLTALFDSRHNPFLRYGQAQLFVAERDGEVVGRISAHINPDHDGYHRERGGFFGFFECTDDEAASQALLESAEDWLQGHAVDWIRGPVSFTMNQEAGTLVDGFDTPPMVAMPHGRPYYDRLLTAAGYAKAKDLLAWQYPVVQLHPRAQAAYARIRAMDGVTVREFERNHFRRDVGLAIEIFNDAWADNWGFVPVRAEEADQLAADLDQFADPDLTALVFVDGEPAAMVVAIPNLNEAARDVNGRLFPWGGLKIKWRLWRGVRTGRVILLGIKQAYRTRAYNGLFLLLFAEVHLRGERRGYDWAELGWVLEDNARLNVALPRMGARVYKTYRLYQKSATAGENVPQPRAADIAPSADIAPD